MSIWYSACSITLLCPVYGAHVHQFPVHIFGSILTRLLVVPCTFSVFFEYSDNSIHFVGMGALRSKENEGWNVLSIAHNTKWLNKQLLCVSLSMLFSLAEMDWSSLNFPYASKLKSYTLEASFVDYSRAFLTLCLKSVQTFSQWILFYFSLLLFYKEVWL